MAHDTWRRRKVCSAACWKLYVGIRSKRQAAEGRHPATRAVVTAGAYRVRAQKLYPLNGRRCETCGKLATDRHHRDEDPSNNTPENIGFFCSPCHSRHHNNVLKRWAKA